MRLLKGTIPTEFDITEMGTEIQLLGEREFSLLPQLREVFHAQVKSAEEQLQVFRTELARLTPEAASSSVFLSKLIVRRWEKLNLTLMMAEAYCS